MRNITTVNELTVNWLYSITSKFYELNGLYYYMGKSTTEKNKVLFVEKGRPAHAGRYLYMTYTPVRKKLKWFKDTKMLETLDFRIREE